MKWAVLLVLSLAQLPFPQRDTRPAPAPMPVGTGTLAGVVVTDEPNSRPVRHATVTLSAGDLQVPRVTVTDDAGRFGFDALASGNYTLVATRAGYVTTYYGSRKMGRGPGIPIAVLDGQKLPDVSLRLARGAILSGTVRSQDGAPAPNVTVLVLQAQISLETRSLVPTLQNVTTDDRGVYRAFGLAPGSYVVQVQPTAFGPGADMRPTTAEEIEWLNRVSATTPAAAGPPPAPPAAPDMGHPVTYAPVYYPGTTIAPEAALIPLGLGEEKTGVDLTLKLVPTARITGTVLDAEGRPQPGMNVSIQSTTGESMDAISLVMGVIGGGSATSRDGTFAINSVRPGSYRLLAKGTPRADNAAGPPAPAMGDAAMAMAMMFGGRGGAGASHWAMQDLTIDGRDVSDLTLRLQPGMTFSGRIVFESTTLQPPTDLASARVSLSGASGGKSIVDMVMSMFTSNYAATTSDGTFAAKGLTPGQYRVTVSTPGSRQNPTQPGTGWMLKSVVWKGHDVADVPLEIKAGEDVTGVVVTMTDHPTELSGTVYDQAGRPMPNFPIVVFPTDRTYWTLVTRRVQMARPSTSGAYLIAGLPPGEYYVCAVGDLELSDLTNPGFLDQLIAASFKITLAEGEHKRQDVKMTGGH